MSHPIVDVERFSMRIGDKEILKEISFSVNRGEFLAIIGPNGAGKTTLLKCMIRILRGGVGSIKINAQDLSSFKQRELAKLVSYVPQSDGRVFPFTVREFVTMGRYPYLSPFSALAPADVEAVEHVLEVTRMAAFGERLIDTLSGGERQKVFIAAALAQGGQLLLLDEPATFLDYRHQVEIYEILQQINKEKKVTIVAVTHDVNSAIRHSERVLALKDGVITFDGPARRIADNGILEQLYDTSFFVTTHPEMKIPVLYPKAAK